jgi:hypothetical protein
MIDPRTLDACIYLLLGGVAKGRLRRDASAAETPHWRICVLYSGERPWNEEELKHKVKSASNWKPKKAHKPRGYLLA